MLTLVPPPLGAAVALADAVPDALLDAEELELSDFLSPDEQPDRPAMTSAAPPTATTKPRFTSVLLLFCRDPSRSADHLGQYGSQPMRRHANGRKICPRTNCSLAAVQRTGRRLRRIHGFRPLVEREVRHHGDIAHGGRTFHQSA